MFCFLHVMTFPYIPVRRQQHLTGFAYGFSVIAQSYMVSWTFPMAYSKATLKSNGAKASP
jgi:hypothetical protein